MTAVIDTVNFGVFHLSMFIVVVSSTVDSRKKALFTVDIALLFFQLAFQFRDDIVFVMVNKFGKR